MFKNTSKDGRKNICGTQVAKYRKRLHGKVSQKKLSDKLRILGLDIDKNAIQRIESGERYVTDIELLYLAKVLNVSLFALIDPEYASLNLPVKININNHKKKLPSFLSKEDALTSAAHLLKEGEVVSIWSETTHTGITWYCIPEGDENLPVRMAASDVGWECVSDSMEIIDRMISIVGQ